ncbi:MAG: hypothetical protein A2Y12_05020 [Planctomycetes bacterium GWF2_42_9]|nr:MAG: hypothetical protein A2Y12_05020 [Planctomycetes bacterium GWF2_42_9]
MEHDPQEVASKDWLHRIALAVDEFVKAKSCIVQFQQMITKWSSEQDQRVHEHDYWQGQRQRHFEEEVSTDPDLQQENRQPPFENWVFESYNRAEHFGSKNRQHRIISYQGWVPPELAMASEPDCQSPLPLPVRAITLTEKYAVLAAVHDYFCNDAEYIDPWQDAKEAAELMAALAYTVLVHDGVEQLTESDRDDLEVFLEDIKADVAAIPVESLPQLAGECKPDDQASNIFRKNGDFWIVRFNSKTVNIKHTKGMDYIAKLLAMPSESIAVVRLTSYKVDAQLLKEGKTHQAEYYRDENDPPLEDDIREKKEIRFEKQLSTPADSKILEDSKRMLDELESEIAKAESNNDFGMIDKLRQEKRFLVSQLKEMIDPRNKNSNLAADADHIRKAVTNAISRALENIGEHHKELYLHLDNSISRGFQLMYAPERETLWNL